MSKFQQVNANPPVLEVKVGANEVIFTTVASMCDNVHYMKFKRQPGGEFKMNCFSDHCSHSYNNFGFKIPQFEMEWLADEGNWPTVIKQINSGYQRIMEVKSR